MDREKIDEFLEKTILGLVLGILVAGPLALGANRTWSFLMVEALGLLAMLLWVARIWVAKSYKFFWPPICWVVLVFMGWVFYQYQRADIEYVARWEMLRVFFYGFLFLLIINNLYAQESKQTLGLTLVFLGMAISFYAGYQFLAHDWRVYTIDNSIYKGRGSGTFICPNNLSGFLEMILPLGIAYAFVGRISQVMKVFVGYASLMILAGIVCTVSRGGYVVAALSILVVAGIFFTQRDYRIHAGVLLGLVIVGGFIAFPHMTAMKERVNQMVASGKTDDLRYSLWWPTVQMWREHFWVGVGPGEFDYRFPAYRPAQVQLRAGYVHNDYLNTLADYGVIGTLIVLSSVVCLFWGIFRSWRMVRGSRDDFSRKRSSKFAFMIGATVGIIAILLHSFLDFNMHIPANAILAITLMALLSSQLRFATESFWFRAGYPTRMAASIILLSGIGFLGFWAVRGAREWRFLDVAENLNTERSNYSPLRMAALKKAIEVEPKNFATYFELGECYRRVSWDGPDDYKDQAHNALENFKKAAELNPYDAINWLKMGMCVDWTGYHPGAERDDSSSYYLKASELDPNNYFVTLNAAWHFTVIGDWAAARTWFERSIRLEWKDADNKAAYKYLKLAESRLAESALSKNRQ